MNAQALRVRGQTSWMRWDGVMAAIDGSSLGSSPSRNLLTGHAARSLRVVTRRVYARGTKNTVIRGAGGAAPERPFSHPPPPGPLPVLSETEFQLAARRSLLSPLRNVRRRVGTVNAPLVPQIPPGNRLENLALPHHVPDQLLHDLPLCPESLGDHADAPQHVAFPPLEVLDDSRPEIGLSHRGGNYAIPMPARKGSGPGVFRALRRARIRACSQDSRMT